jgi:hypothetical protein
MDDELAAWRDLTDSPGWAKLLSHAHEEWHGPAFSQLVEQLADKPNDIEALNKLRQVIAAKKAVERLLRTPADQLAKLTRQAEAEHTPHMGRRGAL